MLVNVKNIGKIVIKFLQGSVVTYNNDDNDDYDDYDVGLGFAEWSCS